MGNTGIIFKGSTKYSIAERLGNYIDPKSELVKKFISTDVHTYVLCPELYTPVYVDNKRITMKPSETFYNVSCLGYPKFRKWIGNFINYPRKEGCTVCNFLLDGIFATTTASQYNNSQKILY